jgi:hypothetical protein
MNTNQIKDSVKQYLLQYIKEINANLTAQNRQRTTRYNTYKTTFDLLGSNDPLATPNRTVNTLDETILIKLLGNDHITTIADQLFKLNEFRPIKQTTNNLKQHLDVSYQSIDMSSKMA